MMLLGAVGCGPTTTITTDRSLTASDVLKRAGERENIIHSLVGKGSLTIETPEGSNSGSFRVKLKKPDSLTVEIRGPFGVRVATLALARDQFRFYDWMENRAVVGKPDQKTLRELLHLSVSFGEIFSAFIGISPQDDSTDTVRQFVTGNDAYTIVSRSSARSKEYSVDAGTFIIRGYSMTDDSTGVQLLASASDFTDETPSMPQFLRIVFPNDHRSITVVYDDLRVNVPVSCSFDIPQQAEISYR